MTSTPAQRSKTQLYVPPGTSVEESRRIRKQHWESKFRNRGGIYKPSPTNKLADILLARAINGESPSKASRTRPVTPARQPSPTPQVQPEAGPSSQTIETVEDVQSIQPTKTKSTTRRRTEETKKKRAPAKKATKKAKSAASTKESAAAAAEVSRKRKADPDEQDVKPSTKKRVPPSTSTAQEVRTDADEAADPPPAKSQKSKGKQKASEEGEVEQPAKASKAKLPEGQIASSESQPLRKQSSASADDTKQRRAGSKKKSPVNKEATEDQHNDEPKSGAWVDKAEKLGSSATKVPSSNTEEPPKASYQPKKSASPAEKRKLETVAEEEVEGVEGDKLSSPMAKKRKKEGKPSTVSEKKSTSKWSKSNTKIKSDKNVRKEAPKLPSSNHRDPDQQHHAESSKGRPDTADVGPIEEVPSGTKGASSKGKTKKGQKPDAEPTKAKAKSSKKAEENRGIDPLDDSGEQNPPADTHKADMIRVVIKKDIKETSKLSAPPSKTSKPPSVKAQTKPRSKPKMGGPPKSVLDKIRANADLVEVVDAADELDLFTWASPAKKKT